MKAVIQRVTQSSVSVDNQKIGTIGQGLMVLLGVGLEDSEKAADYLAEKIVHLRIFEDENGKMNRSLFDIKGEILIVSQFTLFGDCRKGRRPSFISAAEPDRARKFYNDFIKELQVRGIKASSGAFQEMMDVSLVNDGPVTFLLDSTRLF